jgi:glycosyltransferase involved in cell wall biosynthesis
LKSEYQLKAFISGDPWLSLIITKFFQIIYYKDCKIQAQIHADIADKKWRNASFKNRVKSHLLKFTLRFTDQIRTVNRGAEFYLKSILKNYGGNIVYAPVPISTEFEELSQLTARKAKRSTNSIGFLGRIENDRGLHKFVDVIERLVKLDLISEVHIAGDGSQRKSFEKALRCYEPAISVFFYGYLQHQALNSFWENINIFISTAESESYGRAIRESLLHGVPIWAVHSNGFRELISTIPEDWFAILDVNDGDDILRSKIGDLASNCDHISYLKHLEDFQKQNLERLVESWSNLVTD